MAKYSFRTDGGLGAEIAPIEIEIATLREAQLEAVAYLGETLRDRPERFWKHQEATMTVSDGAGLILFTLNLSAVLAPALQGSRGASR